MKLVPTTPKLPPVDIRCRSIAASHNLPVQLVGIWSTSYFYTQSLRVRYCTFTFSFLLFSFLLYSYIIYTELGMYLEPSPSLWPFYARLSSLIKN